MMKKALSDPKIRTAGPYSPLIVSGDLVFLSGQLGVDADGVLAEDLQGQMLQAFLNVEQLLEEVDLDFRHILKTTVYLADMADFDLMNQIYAVYFSQPYPVRTCVAVKGLPKGALFEIEVIARNFVIDEAVEEDECEECHCECGCCE